MRRGNFMRFFLHRLRFFFCSNRRRNFFSREPDFSLSTDKIPIHTYCSGRSSEGNRGCNRRHSKANRDLRPARHSFVRRCNCLAGLCPKMVFAQSRL